MMLKMILGGLLVVGLVGYGIITTDDIEAAGSTVKNTVNAGAAWVKEQTDPSALDQAKDLLK
jgi:hypothetical protein